MVHEKSQDVTIALKSAQLFNEKVIEGKGVVYHFKKFSPIDIGIKADKVYLIEHKRRNHNFGDYPTIWLSLSKYHTLTSMPINVVPIFIVTWNDFMGYINLNKVEPVSARIDRRVAGDREDDYKELIVEFDINDFILF